VIASWRTGICRGGAFFTAFQLSCSHTIRHRISRLFYAVESKIIDIKNAVRHACKMDLGEIGIDGAKWIRLAQDRVQWRAFLNTVMNLRIP
jgi:hypothetical protein